MSVVRDPAVFFATIRDLLFNHSMSQSQVDGVNSILDAWETLDGGADTRWVAYALATAYHETARAMQPIREYGEGRGKPYGKEINGHVYYGRGLVQLTWIGNYQKMEALIPGSDLVNNPDNALVPNTSAKIMIIGMTKGIFTGRSLSDYFWGTHADWIDARRIINALDRASLIAGYALHFYHAIEEV